MNNDHHSYMYESTDTTIPADTPTPSCPNGHFYRLKKNESLAQAAQRHGLDLAALLEANPFLNPATCLPGQTIILPPKGFKGPTPPLTHVLGSKETLADVLRRFDMSVVELRSLNPGKDLFALQSGDRICVRQPPLRPHIKTCVLAAGETLNSAARRLGCDPALLLRLNPNLHPGEFCGGQRIRIP